jgi:Protein of unknown function (DUF1242)
MCLLLSICTCTYAHYVFPSFMDGRKDGCASLSSSARIADHGPSPIGIFWKLARIGERLSPYVSICCVLMAVSVFAGR